MKTLLKQRQRVWLVLCAFSGFGLTQSVQAASFDCAKAQTAVERMICADAELSTLDDELAAAYASTLKGSVGVADVRNAQKRWIKERNSCGDVACLHASYSGQIALLKSAPTSGSATAADSATAPISRMLAPFTFGPAINNSMVNQKEEPVCLDFLSHLNRPRSNELFKPDGSLVHESEKIKSVYWKQLDKEKYREGFMTVVDAEKAINIREGHLKRYADPEWILERTLAHPLASRPKPNAPENWLYRLILPTPYTRNMFGPNGKVELPTWFPNLSTAWLGDAKGFRHPNDRGYYGGSMQWFEHDGKTYAVRNQTFGGDKGAKPKYLAIVVAALNVDTEGNSFIFSTCALRARNNE